MNAEYIRETYAEARKEADAARSVYATATRKGVKRDAAETLEFWTNRAASMWAAAKHYGVELA